MQAKVPIVLDMLLCYNIVRIASETSLGRKRFCYSPANKRGTQLFSDVSICSGRLQPLRKFASRLGEKLE